MVDSKNLSAEGPIWREIFKNYYIEVGSKASAEEVGFKADFPYSLFAMAFLTFYSELKTESHGI